MPCILTMPSVFYVQTSTDPNTINISATSYSTGSSVIHSQPAKQEEKAMGDCVRKGCFKLGHRGTSKRSICETCFEEWCRLPGHDEEFPAFLDTTPGTYFLGNVNVPIPRAVLAAILGENAHWIETVDLLLDGTTTDTSMCGDSKTRLGVDLIRVVVEKIEYAEEHRSANYTFVRRKGALHIRRTTLQEQLDIFAKHCMPLKNIIVRDYFYRNQG